MSNTFNFNSKNQQNQVGDNNNNNQTMNNAVDEEMDLDAVLKALEDAFKQEPVDMPEGAMRAEPLSVLGDIRTTAYEAEEKEVEPEQATTVLDRFKEIVAQSGPKIRKALLAFATTTASAYLGENPIVQGVLAAINAVQES